ncbi:MAG TPA: serine protease [Anaeromyxobacter sp.]|nr:serine protease [Anaeromyxobacter sp.]
MRSAILTLVVALGSTVAPPPPPEPAPAAPPAAEPARAPYCTGEYADDFGALDPRARELERQQPSYTFCIRATATYECPYYTADGSLRRTRVQARGHGTAFAYRQLDGGTLLLTNTHVAEWPTATDADHKVEDVPAGCRRVTDALKVVDNEADDYERDDVPLSRVVADPQLDVAVLKSAQPLPVIPWRVGKSAALRERNVVNVRGFPLGAFRADNVGKVISPFDHDEQGEWDHDDFVVDALLSPGSSGSPVLAVSCRTGQLELVGVYHATYARGTALNVVVGIDQVRDLMTTLRRAARPRAAAPPPLDAQARAALAAASRDALEPWFPFGPHPARVRVRADGALLFELLPLDFPVRAAPLLVVEDLPARDAPGFGALGRVWAGRGERLKPWTRSDLDAEALAQLDRALDALRRDARRTFDLRAAEQVSDGSRAAFDRAARLRRELARAAAARDDLAEALADLAERLAPAAGEPAVSLAEALEAPLDGPPPRAPVPAAAIEPPAGATPAGAP